jgi:hypothetical protein
MSNGTAGQAKAMRVRVANGDVVHDSIVRQANGFSKSVGHWKLSTFGAPDRRETGGYVPTPSDPPDERTN